MMSLIFRLFSSDISKGNRNASKGYNLVLALIFFQFLFSSTVSNGNGYASKRGNPVLN